MRMRPITKILFLFITTSLLFITMFFLLNKTYNNIIKSSNEVAIYNDSILSVKNKFNKYLISDNINIYSFNKSKYIYDTKSNLDTLNMYVKNEEITKLILEKEKLIKSLNIKTYKVKETYGIINYEVKKGFIFKSKKIKQITYRKIDKREIEKLNKIEKLNVKSINSFVKENKIINLKLNNIIVKKIDYLKNQKSKIIKTNLDNSNNNFIIIILIMIFTIIVIIMFLISIIKDIILIMKKNELNKITLSFLINHIKK